MTESDALDLQPTPISTDPVLVNRCVEAGFDCAQACTACADACLREPTVAELASCVRAALDCADLCDATARLLSRRIGQHRNLVRAFLDTCVAACASCAEECSRHAEDYEQCRACAEACRACEQACLALLDVL